MLIEQDIIIISYISQYFRINNILVPHPEKNTACKNHYNKYIV